MAVRNVPFFRKLRGFTFAEILVAILIMAIVAGSVLMLGYTYIKPFEQANEITIAKDRATMVLTYLEKRILHAGLGMPVSADEFADSFEGLWAHQDFQGERWQRPLQEPEPPLLGETYGESEKLLVAYAVPTGTYTTESKQVVPATGEPRRIVDEPQRTQRLDQLQLPPIEVGEVLVAGEHVAELPRHRRAIARQEHPQVLHRGAVAGVVQVDEVRAVVGPQQIAGVAVAVQPQQRQRLRFGHPGLDHGDALVRRRDPGRIQLRGQHAARANGGDRFVTVGGGVDDRTGLEWLARADIVDAADELADAMSHRLPFPDIVQLRHSATLPRKHGEAELPDVRERGAAGHAV